MQLGEVLRPGVGTQKRMEFVRSGSDWRILAHHASTVPKASPEASVALTFFEALSEGPFFEARACSVPWKRGPVEGPEGRFFFFVAWWSGLAPYGSFMGYAGNMKAYMIHGNMKH